MLNGNTREEKIWNFLSDKIKNDYGVAGLMGNLYAESALVPTNLQNTFEKKLNLNDQTYTLEVDNGTYDNFITDKAGYGLAQWTYSTRKQGLLEYAMKKGTSIGDLEMQLEYLYQELTTNFKIVLNTLIKAKTVKAASDAVLLKFEKPEDTSTAVKQKRQKFGEDFYNKYHKAESTAKISEPQVKETITSTPALKIVPSYGINNTNYLANRPLEWIVIHYTAGTTSKEGSALNLAAGARNGGLSTSAEFYVDDKTVVQYIQDINNRYSWSVGGSKYSTMSTSLGGLYYGKCTNKNSINIEICSNKVNKKSLNGDDTDWYFTQEELILAAELVKKLMKDYNIDINHVIMHHAVSGKNCPCMWTHNEGELKGWYNFLEMVAGKKIAVVQPVTPTTVNNNSISNAASVPYLIKVSVAALNVRSGPGVNYRINTIIKDKNAYTIVEEKNGWGKLKSGAGWINLKYTNKI